MGNGQWRVMVGLRLAAKPKTESINRYGLALWLCELIPPPTDAPVWHRMDGTKRERCRWALFVERAMRGGLLDVANDNVIHISVSIGEDRALHGVGRGQSEVK